MPIYLTGGTAIGRFYLDHRYCDSLYCNVDDGDRYLNHISLLKNKLESIFIVDLNNSYFTEEFARFIIVKDELILKLELVRNINKHQGNLTNYKFGFVDSPVYVLPKKLRAITWRNETEDFFDIVHIARNYSFNWSDFYPSVKQGTTIKLIDIETQLVTYPVESIENAHWLKYPFNLVLFKNDLKQIAKDIVAGSENSLGKNKIAIGMAQPLKEFQI